MHKEDSVNLRIAFNHFLFLIRHDNIGFDELVSSGSGPHELEEVFKTITDKGIDLHLIPRLESSENQTVDQIMQLSIYQHARKYKN